MKQFPKKTDLTLLVLSLVVAVIGSVIIAMSENLLYLIQNFLETKVFHRTFRIEKWADTINAIIAFPIFIAIFFDAVLFVKFSKKSKIILLSFYGVLTVFFLILCTVLKSEDFINSDSASNILLSFDCWLEKTLWPKTYCYSTEFPVFSPQVLMTPIFAFTKNWHIIKIVYSFISCSLLPLSLLFLLNQINVKSVWVKTVSCIVFLAPWSLVSWSNVQFGNYYIMTIAETFVYIGLCLALVYKQNSRKKEKVFVFLFCLLTFCCGLTSIRSILIFQFPVAAVALCLAIVRLVNSKQEFNIKFFIDKKVFYPLLGFVIACFGYILNSFVISRIFSFSNFNTTRFAAFNEIPFVRWCFDILKCFGYRDQVGVLTPSGVVNVCAYVLILFFVLCAIEILRKKDIEETKFVFVLYAVTIFIFNLFVFVNTEYYDRYVLILVLCAAPCIAVFADTAQLSVIKRTVLSLVSVVILFTSSFLTYATVLSYNGNTAQKALAKFLLNENYTFGYADFWRANIFSYLTDGKVEVQRMDFPNRKFLATKRYDKDDYKANEKVFLLLTLAEAEKFPEVFECEKAIKVYEDEKFIVLNFESNALFRSEWGKEGGHLYRLSLR